MLIPTKPPGSPTLLGHPGPPFTGTYLTNSVSLSGLPEPNPIYPDTRCGHFFPWGLNRLPPPGSAWGERNSSSESQMSQTCGGSSPHPSPCQAQLGWRGWNPNIDAFFAFLQLTSLWGHLGCWERGDDVSPRFHLPKILARHTGSLFLILKLKNLEKTCFLLHIPSVFVRMLLGVRNTYHPQAA